MLISKSLFSTFFICFGDKVLPVTVDTVYRYLLPAGQVYPYVYVETFTGSFARSILLLQKMVIGVNYDLSDAPVRFLTTSDRCLSFRSSAERNLTCTVFRCAQAYSERSGYPAFDAYFFNLVLSFRCAGDVFAHFRYEFLHHSRAVDAQSKFYGTYRYFGYDDFIEYSR